MCDEVGPSVRSSGSGPAGRDQNIMYTTRRAVKNTKTYNAVRISFISVLNIFSGPGSPASNWKNQKQNLSPSGHAQAADGLDQPTGFDVGEAGAVGGY